ncbi:MAG TPA: hypothetical protein DDX71_00985 [Ruminococcus sp.]|nr:hypothetical protein [Ruminococcus sp.]
MRFLRIGFSVYLHTKGQAFSAMDKKLTAIAATALLIIALSAIIALATHHKSAGDSTAESSVTETEPAVVPSTMPSSIAVTPPAGFSETSSPYYDKYFVKDDASIIITGEKLAIDGIRTSEYVTNVKSQYEKTASDYELLGEENLTVSGAQTTILEFNYAIVGDDVRQDMTCMTGVAVKGRNAYIITCKSKHATYAGYRDIFREFIKSINLADVNIYSVLTSDSSAATTAAPFSATTASSPAETAASLTSAS